jgi:hypothetical protein
MFSVAASGECSISQTVQPESVETEVLAVSTELSTPLHDRLNQHYINRVGSRLRQQTGARIAAEMLTREVERAAQMSEVAETLAVAA